MVSYNASVNERAESEHVYWIDKASGWKLLVPYNVVEKGQSTFWDLDKPGEMKMAPVIEIGTVWTSVVKGNTTMTTYTPSRIMMDSVQKEFEEFTVHHGILDEPEFYDIEVYNDAERQEYLQDIRDEEEYEDRRERSL